MKWLRMRPADMTELDETRRYWDEHDGDDVDRPDDDDMTMVDVRDGNGVSVDRRKKLAGRRRKANGSGAGGGSPMDTNGAGVGGAG